MYLCIREKNNNKQQLNQGDMKTNNTDNNVRLIIKGIEDCGDFGWAVKGMVGAEEKFRLYTDWMYEQGNVVARLREVFDPQDEETPILAERVLKTRDEFFKWDSIKNTLKEMVEEATGCRAIKVVHI